VNNIYTVGPEQDFSTIQDAIDQAVLDGVSTASPAAIDVAPGVYVGDVALVDGVFLYGRGQGGGTPTGLSLALQTVIEGNVVADFAGSAGITNMAVVPTAGVALEVKGVSTMDVLLWRCRLFSPDAHALLITNTGPSLVGGNDLEIQAGSPGIPSVEVISAGTILFLQEGTCSHSDPDAGVCLKADAGATAFVIGPRFAGRVVADGAVVSTYSQFEVGAQPAVSVGGYFANGLGIIQSSDPGGFAVVGAGAMEYSGTVMRGVEEFDAALTLIPKTLRDAGLLKYIPSASADWAGDPAKAGDAIDRLAAVVNGLLNGSVTPGSVLTGIP